MKKSILILLLLSFSKFVWANKSELRETILDDLSLKTIGFEFLILYESDSIEINLSAINRSKGIKSIEFAVAKSDGDLIFSQYLSIENHSQKPLFSFRKYDLESEFEYMFLFNVDCAHFPEFPACYRTGGEFLFRLEQNDKSIIN